MSTDTISLWFFFAQLVFLPLQILGLYLCSKKFMRYYFAAKVMHQLFAGSRLPAGYDATEAMRTVAVRSYEMADEMLKAGEA